MYRIITPLAGAFAVLLATSPEIVQASQQGVQVIKNWKTSDVCAHRAQEAFPDFTAESNAKRDAKLRECLEGARLPPRVPSTPSQ